MKDSQRGSRPINHVSASGHFNQIDAVKATDFNFISQPIKRGRLAQREGVRFVKLFRDLSSILTVCQEFFLHVYK